MESTQKSTNSTSDMIMIDMKFTDNTTDSATSLLKFEESNMVFKTDSQFTISVWRIRPSQSSVELLPPFFRPRGHFKSFIPSRSSFLGGTDLCIKFWGAFLTFHRARLPFASLTNFLSNFWRRFPPLFSFLPGLRFSFQRGTHFCSGFRSMSPPFMDRSYLSSSFRSTFSPNSLRLRWLDILCHLQILPKQVT